MIYDLKVLAKEFDEAIDQADAVRTSGRALLAIAERLEALVEAQKKEPTSIDEIKKREMFR